MTSILELIDSIPKPESAPATSSPPKMTEVRFLKETLLKKSEKYLLDINIPILKGAQESDEQTLT